MERTQNISRSILQRYFLKYQGIRFRAVNNSPKILKPNDINQAILDFLAPQPKYTYSFEDKGEIRKLSGASNLERIINIIEKISHLILAAPISPVIFDIGVTAETHEGKVTENSIRVRFYTTQGIVEITENEFFHFLEDAGIIKP